MTSKDKRIREAFKFENKRLREGFTQCFQSGCEADGFKADGYFDNHARRVTYKRTHFPKR